MNDSNVNNSKTCDKNIQTGESYTAQLMSPNKPTTINHIKEVKESINQTHHNKNNPVNASFCFHFLLNQLKDKCKDNKNDIVNIIVLISFFLFGINTTVLFGIILVIYRMITSDSTKKEPNDVTTQPSIKSIKSEYENLNVPKQNSLKLKKINKRFKNLRKKELFREYQSDDENSSEEEAEIYFAPDVPSSTPTSAKFHIKGHAGHETINFEVDTGSAVSIINIQDFRKIDPALILNQQEPTKEYRDFSGKKIPFSLEATITVNFDNLSITHPFLISEKENSTNLLGIDIIRSKRLNLEFGYGKEESRVFLTFYNHHKKVKQKVELTDTTEYEICVVSDTILKGNTTTHLITKVKDEQINRISSSELYNCVGVSTTDISPFTSEKMLSTFDVDGSLTIPLTNHQFGDSILFSGQVVGKFQLLKPGTEIYDKRINTTEVVGENHKVVPNLTTTIRKLESHLEKGKSINKIKLVNDDQTSEVASESDLAETIYPQRIPEKESVWTDLLSDVPPHLRKRVFHTLTVKHPNVVSKSNTDFGCCTLTNSEFCIELTDSTHKSTKPYPLNRVYELQLKEVIDEMVANNLLIPESSPYSSGVFIRPRPDSTNTGNCRIRVINDYRGLNAVTTPDCFPLPSINTLLQKLNGNKYFVLMDLKDSYQSIKIRKSDRFKASIITSFGQFSPQRMQYGFKNAPSWFSRQISRVVYDLKNCLHYMDDIIIFGQTPEEVIKAFEIVVEKLDKAGFKISLQKLKMFKSKLKLLGVVISKEGITCDPAKIQGITECPEPTTKQQVQRFLGMMNFISDFIPNYSLKAAPLYSLTSIKSEKVNLNDIERKAFLELKRLATKPTMLAFIDPKKPIYLETDASNTGYGAVAYQVDTYDTSAYSTLQSEMERTMNLTVEEINDELKHIIHQYVNNLEVPHYEPEDKPSSASQTNFSPFLNGELKVIKKKQKIFVPRTIFFVSKKFSESQVRCWSSLMKELTAILDCIEKRSDYLSMAKEVVVVSDCSACMYLYHQSKSNSLMSRYMARLACYPFKILVKHKSGEKLTLADNLSRIFVIDSEEYNRDKIPHNAGIIVRNPFPLGSVITTSDIITLLQKGDSQYVTSANHESITKPCQTEISMLDIKELFSKEPETVNTVHPIKSKILEEIKQSLNTEEYVKRQKNELQDMYLETLTKTKDGYKIINGILMTLHKGNYKRLTPPTLRNSVLSKVHLLGHYSGRTMAKIVSRTDIWPGLVKDCNDFTRTCLSCLWIRPPRGPHHRLGLPLTGRVNEILQIDIVSGLPSVNGFSFFTTVIDVFSRFIICYPLRQDKTNEIVSKLESQVFSPFGPPKIIITDGAMNLGKSQKFKDLCNLYGSVVKIRSPYSSRSLGLVERAHRSLLDIMRSLSDSFESNWLINLPLAVSIYNSTPHGATKISPFELRFGYSNRLFNPLTDDTSLICLRNTNFRQYNSELKQKLKKAYDLAKKYDDSYKEAMRQKFGGKQSNFEPGTFVLSQNKTPSVGQCIKTRDKYYGPFLVKENLHQVVFAENVMNNKTTYLHKNLCRIIPQKSLEKYADMPEYAKKIFGGGVNYEIWKDLHDEGKLKEFLKTRNHHGLEYGEEGPVQRFEPVLEAREEISNANIPQIQDELEESSEQELQVQIPNNSRVTFNLPEGQESQRPSRTIRRPNRLDL